MTDWVVPCQLIRVIDGDTIVVRADLGWHIELETSVRVQGINAPELSTPEGIVARDFIQNLLAQNGIGQLVSTKYLGGSDKYGRVLGNLILPDTKGVMVNVAQTMLDTGHAVPYPS